MRFNTNNKRQWKEPWCQHLESFGHLLYVLPIKANLKVGNWNCVHHTLKGNIFEEQDFIRQAYPWTTFTVHTVHTADLHDLINGSTFVVLEMIFLMRCNYNVIYLRMYVLCKCYGDS